MDLFDLRDATFTSLGDAVDDWGHMVTKLSELEKDAQQGMKGQADRADWKGMNASVTKEFIGRTAKEFADAHTEATTVQNILKQTHGELVSYQKQLHTALDDAERQNLYVSCSGSQIIVTGKQSGPSGPASGSYHEEDLQAMLRLLQGILNKANESDSSTAKVLDELMKQKPYGFSNAAYTNRKEAADAIEAAEKYANLMKKKGDDMSPAEFDKLNKILKCYQDDPLFQEKFAESLGPRGLLDFWMDLSDPSDHGQLQKLRRSGQFAELQTNLGTVLAGATQSDSPAMQKWENDVVQLGNQKFTTGHSRAYGFQLISNLMRTGDWNNQFLDTYGNALVATEKKDGRPNMLWNDLLEPHPGDKTFPAEMNFIGKDNGRDPMAGVMQAMSDSPDESAHFFSDKANSEWVLKDRPVFDTTPGNSHDGNQTLEASGRALIAAATGANPDGPNAHTVPHTPENQAAFKNALSVLAQAGDKMHPELRDDMATVLVNHGPEFLATANADTDTDAGGHPDLLLNRQDMREVTKQIARDGGAYHMLFDGMSKVVEQDVKTTDYPDSMSALRNAGSVFGYLEENRVEAIGNDKPDTAWATQWASTGVSVASDFLPAGGNSFSAAGGLLIKAWDDHQQAGIDDAAISKVQSAYDIRTGEMDRISHLYEQRYPDQMAHHSRSDLLDKIQDGVGAGTLDVQRLAGVTPPKSG